MNEPEFTPEGLPILAPMEILKWVKIILAPYKQRPSPELLEAFRIGLADLTAKELTAGFSEALRRHSSAYSPVPGEIRAYLTLAKNRMSQPENLSNPNCPICHGTGYKVTPEGASPCDCWRKTEATK